MLEQLQSFTVENRPGNKPRVVPIDSESATSVVNAISSETAREIIATLHENPEPPSRIADGVDTSIANVNYHLEKLQEADLITDVDTWYSEKGREMKVYAPTDDPLVFAGDEDRTRSMRSILQQVGTAVVLLAAASALVQWFVSDVLVAHQQLPALRKATSAGAIEGLNLTPVPPGLLFFTGGTFVLTLTLLGWFVSTKIR